MNLKKKILFAGMLGTAFYGKAQQQHPTLVRGKIIFQEKCIRCHGDDGALGKFGASNLKNSKLPDDKLDNIINNGKWFMPKWRKILNPTEISSVIIYIKTLRTNAN